MAIATLAAFGMECLQIFVWSRDSDVTDALVGTIAAFAGWVGTVVHLRLSGTYRECVADPSERSANYGLPGLVLLLWALIVFYVGWQPFDFTTSRDFLAERQEQFTWVPFGDYRIQTEFVAFEQTLHKTLLFVPLGAILAATWSTTDRRLVSLVALLLAFMVASAVEVGQFYLPGHTASVTDVLIEMAGTLVGCVMGVRLSSVLSQASCPNGGPMESVAEAVEPATGPTVTPVASGLQPEPPELTVKVLVPRSGWHMLDFKELWRYRELLFFLTWRDVKVRYKQTVLGAAWAILQPLATMIVFSLFFGRVAGGSARSRALSAVRACGPGPLDVLRQRRRLRRARASSAARTWSPRSISRG